MKLRRPWSKIRRQRHLNIAAMLALLLTACASAPPPPEHVQGDHYAYTKQYLRWMINEEMVEHDIVGLSIALVDDQQLIWAEGFGFANERHKQPATEHTVYRVGSITKLFTASAVMQLYEQGMLDIDKPLQHYLPQFAINSRFEPSAPITARNLMTHHSGLPSDYINHMMGDESADFTQMASLLKEEYLAHQPNTILSYSNLGFTLLGHLVEQVSGQSYADYIEQHILQAADMHQAYIAANMRKEAHSASGYFNNKAHKSVYIRDVPAGGLHASVLDMVQFAKMCFADGRSGDRQILKAQTLAEMQRYQDGDAVFDVNRSIGLAWFLDNRYQEQIDVIARHNGGTPLFISEFLTLPKHKLAVVVLANSNSAARSLGKIAEKALKLALQSKTGIELKDSSPLKQTLNPTSQDLNNMPGDWATPGGLVHVERSGNRLYAQINGQTLDLVRREDDLYHLQYKLLGLFPMEMDSLEKPGIAIQNIAGREVATIHIDGKARGVIAEKIGPTPITQSWRKRLGSYQATNSEGIFKLNSLELSEQDGLLLMKLELQMPFDSSLQHHTEVLKIIDDQQAVIYGLGRGKGDTVRWSQRDGETLLKYSGFELRRTQ